MAEERGQDRHLRLDVQTVAVPAGNRLDGERVPIMRNSA
jgi:hypothetical protein